MWAPVSFGDYRGADTTHVYVLPVPYFVYRGRNFLQADRNGIRGLLFNQEWIELNIQRERDHARAPRMRRQGRRMPDLRSTIEIGPSVDLHLWHSNDSKVKFDVRLPIRTVFTVQSSPRSLGWLFAPNASVDVKDVAGFAGWNFGALAGPLFAARRYDDYFYTVTTQYATPERAAYEASGGYAGTQVLAALSKRYPSFWVGAYVRHDSLGGAVFPVEPPGEAQ